MPSEIKLASTLAGVGVIVALARMLTTDERLTWRVVLGRAILSGALGLAAGAVVIFIPEVSFVGQVALACILTSLGESALFPFFQRIVQK